MRAAVAALWAVTVLAVASVAGPLAFQASEAPPVVPTEGQPGDLTYHSGSMAIRLTEGPCTFSAIRELLESEGIPPVYSYVMVQEGRPQVRGCWVRAAYEDEVLLQDMGGGDAFMPLSWFRRDPGV